MGANQALRRGHPRWSPCIAPDPKGEVYLVSSTFSADLPTAPGTLQPTYAGGGDAFVVKFVPVQK